MVKGHSMIITDADMHRLRRLILDLKHGCSTNRQQLDALEQALQSADAQPLGGTPRSFIRMNSCVRVRDASTHKEESYTLVVPEEADMSRGCISVLAPVGMALLGHRKGEIVEAKVPGGIRKLKITEVQQQRLAAASRQSPRCLAIRGAALGLATGIGT
jgi:regulator of nucleoside diphosphate kinase